MLGNAHQFGLDEVTHYFIVEVFDRGPLDSFLYILLLQRQRQLSVCVPETTIFTT